MNEGPQDLLDVQNSLPKQVTSPSQSVFGVIRPVWTSTGPHWLNLWLLCQDQVDATLAVNQKNERLASRSTPRTFEEQESEIYFNVSISSEAFFF